MPRGCSTRWSGNSDRGNGGGIVGPNGAGKTTLLEILAGRLKPAKGRVEVGPTVRVRLSDQLGRALDPTQRVRDAVAGPTRPPGTPEDKKLMEQFWFDDDVQFAQIHTLSGGERRRLQLLLVLAERPNVLLLDEPTNDLDLDTLRVLEDFAEDWPGALVVVSHDRTFLDRVVEDVLMLENGRAKPVLGGYAGWIAQRAKSGASSSGTKMNVLASSAASAPAVAPVTKAVPIAAEKSRRSPSTLRFLIKEADRELGRATKRRDALTVELEAVVPTDYVSLARIGEQIGDTQADIDRWEETWLELAEESHGE
jgi:ABC transport system ATP-binding/permease protein